MLEKWLKFVYNKKAFILMEELSCLSLLRVFPL